MTSDEEVDTIQEQEEGDSEGGEREKERGRPRKGTDDEYRRIVIKKRMERMKEGTSQSSLTSLDRRGKIDRTMVGVEIKMGYI